MHRTRWIVLIVLVVGIFGGGGVAAIAARSGLEPIVPGSNQQDVVSIPCPATEKGTMTALENAHVLRSPLWFRLYATVRGTFHHLKCGLYSFSPAMGGSEIVAVLDAGPSPSLATIRITFPEGETAVQMSAALTKTTHISGSQYLALARSAGFRTGDAALRPQGSSLEGFLFPDTYDISSTTSASDLIKLQLAAFQHKAAPVLASSHGLSPYEVLVLASIVQAEARYPSDEPLIASVFYNRLANGMPLQSDPTIVYGLTGSLGAEPTAAQFQQDTPYNTYIHTGLPPTPIDNPGVLAIEATVHPATTPYLYFVADPNGHVHYASTLAEHNAQVSEFCGSRCSGGS